MTSARNYATIADRKSKIRKGKNGQKTNVGKHCAAGKAAADPKRFSGDGSATAALSGRVFLFSLGAWACLRRRAAPPLSSMTSSRLTATSGKPVRRVQRMDNDMKKGKHSIKSLPFQWDMKLNSISVLPDIGAIFVCGCGI